MEGWLRLHRKIVDWEWFEDANMVQLFIYLLAKASNAEKMWQGIPVHRGQVICSQQTITANLRMTRQTLRTCMSRLERTGEISIKSTKRFTIVTISKYDDYQYAEGECQPTANQQPTNNQPTSNQQVTNNQPTANHIVRITEYQNNSKSSSLRSELSTASLAARAREGGAGGMNESSCEEVGTEAKQAQPPTSMQQKGPTPEAVMEFFNTAVAQARIPKIAKMTERRVSAIHARASEYGSEAIATAIRKAAASVFLNGGGVRHFVASFDWIFLPNNFPKILEGNYDNLPAPPTTITTTPTPTTHGTPQRITTHRSAEAGRAERENEWLSHAMARLHDGTDAEAAPNPFELSDG